MADGLARYSGADGMRSILLSAAAICEALYACWRAEAGIFLNLPDFLAPSDAVVTPAGLASKRALASPSRDCARHPSSLIGTSSSTRPGSGGRPRWHMRQNQIARSAPMGRRV
jgi:hypothetical protein